MSPLTKIFVVLLVVTSILEAAATVVFVSKVQPLQANLTAASIATSTAVKESQTAQQAQQASDSQLAQERQAHSSDLKAAQAANNDLQRQISDTKVQLAQLQNDKETLSGNLAAANTSLALATATVSKLQTEDTDLTNAKDSLTKASADQTQRIAELTGEKEQLEAKLDDTTQQYTLVSTEEQKLAGWVKDHGGNAEDISGQNSTGGLGAGAPAINGTVRDVQTFSGNTYATLNIGKADGVQKGMTFFVVGDSATPVLGEITVDTVDTNEAVGKVRGDPSAVTRVQKGTVVKTEQALRQ